MIATCADFGVATARVPGRSGVWLRADAAAPGAQGRRDRAPRRPGRDHARDRTQLRRGPVVVRPVHPLRHRRRRGHHAQPRDRPPGRRCPRCCRSCRRGSPSCSPGRRTPLHLTTSPAPTRPRGSPGSSWSVRSVRPTLRGSFGMASSTHWLASQSAMAELETGGNAFDAAIAAAFVLHVVEPHLNGPAGEVPAVFATADDPTPQVLCGQGTGAGRGDPGALPRPRPRPRARLRSARRSDPRRGRRLADAGPRPRHPPAARGALLRDRLRPRRPPAAPEPPPGPWPASSSCSGSTGPPRRARWLPHGRLPRPWELVVNPRARRHAGTTGRGRARPPDATARRSTTARGAPGARGSSPRPSTPSAGCRSATRAAPTTPGVLTGADLAGWSRRTSGPSCSSSATSRSPRPTCGARGRCCSRRWPCWTGSPTRRSTRRRADGVHTVTEVLKLALADREAWYGDASPVTVAELLDPAYVAARRALVGERASARAATRQRPVAGCRVLSAQVQRGSLARPDGGRTRRAHGLLGRPDPRGHLSHRRRRPLGQHHLGHAERRLAAELAHHPGARLLPGQPAPDVLARRRAAGQPGARVGGREPRSPPPWCCGTGDPCWPAARPAATSRTSGSCRSCCTISSAASTSRRRSRRRRSTPPRSRAPSTRGR